MQLSPDTTPRPDGPEGDGDSVAAIGDLVYRFGPFRLDPGRQSLQRDGEPVYLTPRAFGTLAALVASGGLEVSREDLTRRVWAGAHVSEGALSQNVSLVRKALGDSAAAPRYLLTLPGRGYRFVCPVEVEAPEALRGGPRNTHRSERSALRPWLPGLCAALLLLLLITAAATRVPRTPRGETTPHPDEVARQRATPELAPPPGTSADTYQVYLQGRHAIEERTLPSYRRAESLFRRAIELDPSFALAHAGLMETHSFLGIDDDGPALRAIALDPDCAPAYAALGFHRLVRAWDWEAAESNLARAVALDPDYGQGHHWYAYALLVRGKSEQAVLAVHRALATDPFSLIVNTDVGNVLVWARRFEDGAAQLERTIRLDPEFAVAHWRLGEAYLHLGQPRRARAAYRRALELGLREAEPWLGHALAVSGDAQAAREILRATSSDLHRARILVGLRDLEAAFLALDAAVAGREGEVPFLLAEPLWDPLRDDARFPALLRRLGLPTSPPASGLRPSLAFAIAAPQEESPTS